MRVMLIALAQVLLLSLWASETIQAARVAPISPRCPNGHETKHIDWKGQEDACIDTAPPFCPAKAQLKADVVAQEDRCMSDEMAPAKAKKPACPEQYRLRIQAAEDQCERVQRAPCPAGMRYKVEAGEDKCVA
jgi:hypothetical protein